MNVIQIGCNDGNDHVFDFVNQHKDVVDFCILVDANKAALELCKERYKDINNCTFLNYAIVADDTQTQAEIYIPAEDAVSQHVSVLKSHVVRHEHPNVLALSVSAMSINSLLNSFLSGLDCLVLDRLYIDVEGIDAEIISSIDFESYNIDYIFFEHVHSDGPFTWGGPKYDKCKLHLEKNGYVVSVEGPNTVARHHKKDT